MIIRLPAQPDVQNRLCHPPTLATGRNRFPTSVELWYDVGMTAKLSKQLADALHASGDDSLEVVDPRSNRTYVLVDGDTHRRAMEALRRQQDRDAIAEGIADMEAGRGVPLDEARKLTRQNLVSRHR